MQILIVEDEELAVKKLQKMLLSLDKDIEVLDNTDSIAASVDWLKKKSEEILGPDYEKQYSPKPFEE